MTDNFDWWERRDLPAGLAMELHAGDTPAVVLAQGDERIRVDIRHVKAVMAALADGAAVLAELLASGGVFHA